MWTLLQELSKLNTGTRMSIRCPLYSTTKLKLIRSQSGNPQISHPKYRGQRPMISHLKIGCTPHSILRKSLGTVSPKIKINVCLNQFLKIRWGHLLPDLSWDRPKKTSFLLLTNLVKILTIKFSSQKTTFLLARKFRISRLLFRSRRPLRGMRWTQSHHLELSEEFER